MNFRIDWIDGAPEMAAEGMVIQWPNYSVTVIGHGSTPELQEQVQQFAVRHAYLIKPHELEWIADMAQRHGKGRPQE